MSGRKARLFCLILALVLVLAGLGLLLGFTMPKFKLLQTLVDYLNSEGQAPHTPVCAI